MNRPHGLAALIEMKNLNDTNSAKAFAADNQVNREKTEQAVDHIAAVLARLTLSCDLSYQEFIHKYKQHLVKEDRKKRPQGSIVDVAARTNIDRRFITDVLANKCTLPKPTKVATIFAEVRRVCEQKQTRLIHKTKGKHSFESICRRFASGSLTPKAVFKELFRQSKLRDHGDFYELMKPKRAAQRLQKTTKRVCKIANKL